jgi:hypothetical protein
MKKWVILIPGIFLAGSLLLLATPEQKNSLNPRVTVRVFQHENQVKDLKEEDFTVMENSKPVALSGFTVTRRTLAATSAGTSSGRFLFLEFYLHQYGEAVEKYIDFVFHRILGEKDRLMVAAGGQTLYFQSIPDRTVAVRLIDEMLREQATLTRQQMEAEIKGMGKFIDEVRTQV